ncbi:MAG: hemerythrin domain-containing protein [Terriglobia bacterium]
MTSTPATTVLQREHDAILQMLEVAEELGRQLERGRRVSPQTLADLLEFFQVFADRCHHGKEEDLLFPWLEQRGLPREGGPTGVMRSEHEQGRLLVRRLSEAAQAYRRGADEARAEWAALARAYAALLRRHIDKENNVLFPMAESLLSPAEQQELAAAFDRVEQEKLGPGTHERLHALKERLSAEVLS